MKNKIPTILLVLSLTTLFGFTVGQNIELTSFLNGRANPDFLKYSKNVQTELSKGTIGEILEIKKFNSGNFGIKMKVSGGLKDGESYWVYYNTAKPSIVLIDKKTKATITPDEKIKPNKAQAQLLEKMPASRDLDEQAVIEAAKAVSVVLDSKKISAATAAQVQKDCDQETKVTPPPIPPEKVVTPEVAVTEGPRDTFTPQMALADLNSENLKFVGRDLMPGSGQNRTCVFQNSKVFVLYDNCMGNRKEAPVTNLKIVSKTGGEIEFYLENSNPLPNSKLKRDKYDSTWRISYGSSSPPKGNSIADIKKYIEANELSNKYCFVGQSFKAKESAKAVCSEGMQSNKDKWASEAEIFWQNPPEEWYTTQTKLRQLVEKAPY